LKDTLRSTSSGGTAVVRKAVDRKHRRISVGRSHTGRVAPGATSFRLKMQEGGRLAVSAE